MLLRRRSMSQPVADPDLPPTPPPTSSPPIKRPNLTLAIPSASEKPGGGPVSPTAPSPAETGTLVRRRSTVGGRLPSEHPLPSPPPVPSPTLHLPSSFSSSSSSLGDDSPASAGASFWLPASLHPELAPAEFKAFIREQTRPEALARRTSLSAGGGTGTTSGGSLGVGPSPQTHGRVNRRASLLRGEYKPRANDGVGDEEVPPPVPRIGEEHLGGGAGGGDGGGGAVPVTAIKRTTSDGAAARQRRSRHTLNFEELTIRDLQRLEELAAKAESEGQTAGEEEEGERLGRVLRRSLSLNPHRVAAAGASRLSLSSLCAARLVHSRSACAQPQRPGRLSVGARSRRPSRRRSRARAPVLTVTSPSTTTTRPSSRSRPVRSCVVTRGRGSARRALAAPRRAGSGSRRRRRVAAALGRGADEGGRRRGTRRVSRPARAPRLGLAQERARHPRVKAARASARRRPPRTSSTSRLRRSPRLSSRHRRSSRPSRSSRRRSRRLSSTSRPRPRSRLPCPSRPR